MWLTTLLLNPYNTILRQFYQYTMQSLETSAFKPLRGPDGLKNVFQTYIMLLLENYDKY